MSQPGYIAIELMIDKFSEFIEWIFSKKQKTELEKVKELNLLLESEIGTSIFNLSAYPLETLETKLEKTDSRILDKIISVLYLVSISKNKNQTYQKLKSNKNLDQRIFEIIQFSESTNKKLSLESRNIKNSIQQKIKQ